jgi:RNA polymerase sigma factor (sigma-70 family)
VEPGLLRNPARLAGRAVLRTQTDKRLVELVRGGSEPAFEAIVERYRGSLRRYCRQMAPGSCVDDVVQHTFLSTYLALTTDGRDLNLKPWLFRVTHNAALDALRREAWSSERLEESYEGIDRLDRTLEQKNSLRALLSDLGDLPERQRAALVLREMEGRSYDEIARELGVSGGAVRQLLNRARNGLRAAATAVLPPFFLLPLGAKGDRAGVVERIAELASGPGAAAGVAKAGAVLATTGAIGAAALSSGGLEPPAPAGEKLRDSKGAGIVSGAGPAGGAVAAIRQFRSPGGSDGGVLAGDESDGGAGTQGFKRPGPVSGEDDGPDDAPGEDDGPDDDAPGEDDGDDDAPGEDDGDDDAPGEDDDPGEDGPGQDDDPGDDAADGIVALPGPTRSGDDAGEAPDRAGSSPHSDYGSGDDDELGDD